MCMYPTCGTNYPSVPSSDHSVSHCINRADENGDEFQYNSAMNNLSGAWKLRCGTCGRPEVLKHDYVIGNGQSEFPSQSTST
jgi:hypothetical protein